MESNWSQLIDRYYAGELSEEGLKAFEQLKRDDADFAQSVYMHELIIAGLKRAAQREEIQKLGRNYHYRTGQKKWIIGLGIVLVVLLAIVWIRWKNQQTNSLEQTEAIAERVEKKAFQTKQNTDLPTVTDTIITYSIPKKQEVTKTPKTSEIKVEKLNKLNKLNYNHIAVSENSSENIKDGQEMKETTDEAIKPVGDGIEIVSMTPSIMENKVNVINRDIKLTNQNVLLENSEIYWVFLENGKSGLKDRQGKVVLKPQFDSILVGKTSYTSAYIGYRARSVVTDVKACDTIYLTFIEVKQEGKWFLYTEELVQLSTIGMDQFVDLSFKDGLILVRNNTKFGLMDYTGNLVLDCTFDKIENNHGTIYGYRSGKKLKIKALQN